MHLHQNLIRWSWWVRTYLFLIAIQIWNQKMSKMELKHGIGVAFHFRCPLHIVVWQGNKRMHIPYLPVYNTCPCIIRTPIFDQIFHKKSFHSKKKNINASYIWCFAEVSFITISNFLSLVIIVIQYDRNHVFISSAVS